MSFWVDHISNQVPPKQIKSQLYNLKHFVIQKLKFLDFTSIRGSNKSTLNLKEFYFPYWNFKFIDIPWMRQNNAKFGLFVGYPNFGSITELCRMFLKGNDTFQLFFQGILESLIHRWENAFLKIRNTWPLEFYGIGGGGGTD